MEHKYRMKTVLLCLFTCLITITGLFVLYLFDNKYTMDYHSRQDNTASSQISGKDPLFLVTGWELYPDLMLGPEELASNTYSPVDIYIGQYSNLSGFHQDKSAYGDATYRFTFRLGEDRPETLTLYLPEIFSASKVYINGKSAGGTGLTTPYTPHIAERTVSFTTDKENEIVIQTSNYSHYYSGLYYPPAIGSSEAIHRMISVRMIFYGFLCFSSLSAALFSICLWLFYRRGTDRKLNLCFGVLAFSFGLRIAYPFYRTLGISLTSSLYALEDAMTFTGICAALMIAVQLSGFYRRTFFTRMLFAVSGGMCLAGLVIPLAVLPHFPAFIPAYGAVISWYKLAAAAVLVFLSLRCAACNPAGNYLICGTLAYGICLLSTVWLINRFEPARTGWQDEYGSYAMVLCFAVMMVKRSLLLTLENQRLNEHLEEEVAAKTQTITTLVIERQELIQELLHDIKAPVSSIYSCLQLIMDHRIMLDDATKEKIALMLERCQDITKRMKLMQSVTTEDNLDFSLVPLDLREVLQEFHRKNQPDIEMLGPDFLLHLPPKPCIIKGSQDKLYRILQNLLYNALCFTPVDGIISLELDVRDADAVITLSDTGSGIPEEELNHLFDKYYTARAEADGQGLGLFITKKLTEEHGGTIDARSTPGKGTSFIIRLPLNS